MKRHKVMHRFAVLVGVAATAAAVAACATQQTPFLIRLYYKPPTPAAQLGRKVAIVQFADARRPEEGRGDPLRVGHRYVLTRPWPPDLALALAAALRGHGFDATVADRLTNDMGGDVVTGEVLDFSVEVSQTATSAYINAIIRVHDQTGAVMLERHVMERSRRAGPYPEDVLNLTLAEFAAKLATDPALVAALRRPDSAVAVVNGDAITEAELQEAIKAYRADRQHLGRRNVQDVLRAMIDDRLQLQEADREKIIVDDWDINAELNEHLKSYGATSLEEFEKAMKEHGITMAAVRVRLRDAVRIQNIVRRKVRSKVTLTEREVAEHLEASRSKFETVVVARQLLIAPEASSSEAWEAASTRAHSIREQLLNGADFFTQAQLLGRSAPGNRHPKISEARDMESAIRGLKAGEVSDVYRSRVGFHIFRREPIDVSHQDAREIVRSMLFRQKYDTLRQAWLDELRQRSVIVARRMSDTNLTVSSAKVSFDDYMEGIRTKIKSVWRYPCVENTVTRRCDYLSARGILDVSYDIDGRVGSMTIVESSGLTEYDNAMVLAVHLASPLSPMPSELARKRDGLGLRVRVNFSYSGPPSSLP